MFAEYIELQFLEESCDFTLNLNNSSKYQFMKETYQKYIEGKKNILISKNLEILDSCIKEKLRSLTINPAVYLFKQKQILNELEGKPWYDLPEIYTIVDQLRSLIQKYLTIVLISPDQIQPNRVLSDRENEQNQEIFWIIARLFDLFDSVGFDEEIFITLVTTITNQIDSKKLHTKILQYVRSQVFKMHIFDSINLYWSVLIYYLKNAYLKQQIFNGEIAQWNLQIVNPESLEFEFVLGPFLQLSILQNNKVVFERVYSSLQENLSKNTRQNLIKQYQQTNQKHVEKLVELFKLCLTKDYFPKTIQLFQFVCTVNKVKTTEDYSLMLQQRQFVNSNSSGFLLNIFDVILTVSNKISQRNDDTYQKIDANFWYTIPFEGETMIINSQKVLQKQNYQIGNVSYLFFYTLKLLQVCYLPILLEYKESLKHLNEVTEDHETDLEKNQEEEMKIHQLELCLFNSGRIKDIVQLLDTFIYLFNKWICLSKLVDGQYLPSELFTYLPEFLINNIFQFHQFYLQCYKGYPEFLISEKLINFVHFGVYLINFSITQNKQLVGNFIELIFLYAKQSKKHQNYLLGVLCSDEHVKQTILFGLIKYHHFVGSAGTNNQISDKFSYRNQINYFLVRLLKFPFYQIQLQGYQLFSESNKFINALTHDMTNAFDDLWSNHLSTYAKVKYQILYNNHQKIQQQRQLQQQLLQCRLNLQNFKTNLKLLVKLSQYIPDALTNERIITELTYYLKVLMASNAKINLQILKEIQESFKLTVIFQQIGHFFSNISHKVQVIDILLNDLRSFDIDNFRKLESLLCTNIAGQQDIVEKLQNLIDQLEKRQELQAIEQILDKEIIPPDHFLDPLTSDIMQDPVMLPKSKQILDRKTIRLSIQEEPIDPFTNTPLKIEDVIPQPKLKEEIQDWQKKYNEKKEALVKERSQNAKPTKQKFQMPVDDDNE